MTNSTANVLIVMPAYNAGLTLDKVLDSIPKGFDSMVLVDDASADNTVDRAKSRGVETVSHPVNRGYGGNQKTCYGLALSKNAQIVVMLHPDGQYDPKFIPQLVEPIVEGKSDAVFGSRMYTKKDALNGGMPLWKFLSNIILSNIANIVTGARLTDWHSGFRAYSIKCIKLVPFSENSEGYDFDVEMTLRLISSGFKISEVPISTNYNADASSIGFWDSVIYGSRFLKHLTKYTLGGYTNKKNVS